MAFRGGRGRRRRDRRGPVRRAARGHLDHAYGARRRVPRGAGSWETIHTTSKITGASATIHYSQELWGNAFEVLVDHIPIGTTCQLWVVHPDKSRTLVAAWTTAHDEGHVWYAGSMPSTAKPISAFQITAGGQVLLQVTPT